MEIGEMGAKEWRNQKLIAGELRRLREAAGMTRAEMAEKMGEPYTEDMIAHYETGDVLMELWTVLDMSEALHISLEELSPSRLLAKHCEANGYTQLSEQSRNLVDGIIGLILNKERPGA